MIHYSSLLRIVLFSVCAADIFFQCRYQSLHVAQIPGNFGYLSITISIISQCLQPRAIYMKITLFSVLTTCVSASLCCLGVFCAVRAREHTTPPGGNPTDYNSSASVVSAIWFIFDIWLVTSQFFLYRAGTLLIRHKDRKYNEDIPSLRIPGPYDRFFHFRGHCHDPRPKIYHAIFWTFIRTTTSFSFSSWVCNFDSSCAVHDSRNQSRTHFSETQEVPRESQSGSGGRDRIRQV